MTTLLRSRVRGERRREAGFTLMEVMIVMAIISVLMGFGIGMFQKLTAVGRATQARNTLVDLIQQVKTSSLSRPAALVIEPGTDLEPVKAFGLVFRPVQMSGFEPPVGSADATVGEVPGLAYKTGRPEADVQLKPFPWGRTGGCLVSETGSLVNFGNFADYDLVEGVSISVWVYPTRNQAMVLLEKGESWGIKLKKGAGGPVVEAFLGLSDDGNVLPGARSSRTTFEVPNAPLVLNRWNGIEFHYDRSLVTIGIDSFDRGAVERLRKEEKRAIVPDRTADLTLGGASGWFVGRMDDLKISGILSGEVSLLPEDISLAGERRTIRFVDGKLDTAVHRGPETITLVYQGVENPITIGLSGNILLK